MGDVGWLVGTRTSLWESWLVIAGYGRSGFERNGRLERILLGVCLDAEGQFKDVTNAVTCDDSFLDTPD